MASVGNSERSIVVTHGNVYRRCLSRATPSMAGGMVSPGEAAEQVASSCIRMRELHVAVERAAQNPCTQCRRQAAQNGMENAAALQVQTSPVQKR